MRRNNIIIIIIMCCVVWRRVLCSQTANISQLSRSQMSPLNKQDGQISCSLALLQLNLTCYLSVHSQKEVRYRIGFAVKSVLIIGHGCVGGIVDYLPPSVTHDHIYTIQASICVHLLYIPSISLLCIYVHQ